MNDDVERKLEEFYRGFDESARRVEARWKAQPPARSRAALTGLALAGSAGVAAAILVLFWALRPEPAAQPGTLEIGERRPPPPLPHVAHPREPARRPEPPVVTPPPPSTETPKPPEPRPEKPDAPRPEEPKPPAPEAPKPEPPKPTTAERAVAVLRETEGTFDLGERQVRTRQKDLRVATGDILRSTTVAKLVLSEDRFVLVGPRSVIELRPDAEGLSLHLDQGELLAELVGPGPAVRVATRACEVKPLGTVFSVKSDKGRTSVTVEKGKVEVRNARGTSTPRAGELVVTSDDGAPSVPAPTDLKGHAWARTHRPPERVAYFEDFAKPGAWSGEVDKGVAKGLPAPGLCAARLDIGSERPPLFEAPVRGQIQIVYRTDRAAKMYVQFFASDVRTNFRKDVQVLRGSAWRTLALDLDEFTPTLRDRHSGKVPPGAPVTSFGIYYGEGEERGAIWVDSIRVVEVRP